ncbi:hypothetical protein NN3_18150 [Nocardia neocaledoniensis NBRC 108232]|uniref:NlpC/P60 family protein n=1 Tax=Nocardia neocaledoniensis TaxID=236511 RepID=A0A317N629_9NOCA|nr:NlpC/P60 family protein [Nocardia neocaledoniensis]PWV70462.1 hypothetical protein DFR69_113176 [Nocardia neocaledoniensis]GEM30808.1 hypothetical protein NN3_18150 [Nocardia neocaledoniensis NBRC 108232]
MIRNLVTTAVTWRLVLLGATVGLTLVTIAFVASLSSFTSSVAADLRYQCDSAVGPDPSADAAPAPTPPVSKRASPRTAPPSSATTNPYAELTIDSDDPVTGWERECLSAMKTAPYQDSPDTSVNAGPAVECARHLALLLVSAGSMHEDDTGPRSDMAATIRSLVFDASMAAETGECRAAQLSPATGGSLEESSSQAGAGSGHSCPPFAASGSPVLLPSTVAAQARCGQRVAPAALSAGDLVFWNYHQGAPRLAAIAVGGNDIIVAGQGSTGHRRTHLPTESDVRIKRVLGGAA